MSGARRAKKAVFDAMRERKAVGGYWWNQQNRECKLRKARLSHWDEARQEQQAGREGSVGLGMALLGKRRTAQRECSYRPPGAMRVLLGMAGKSDGDAVVVVVPVAEWVAMERRRGQSREKVAVRRKDGN